MPVAMVKPTFIPDNQSLLYSLAPSLPVRPDAAPNQKVPRETFIPV